MFQENKTMQKIMGLGIFLLGCVLWPTSPQSMTTQSQCVIPTTLEAPWDRANNQALSDIYGIFYLSKMNSPNLAPYLNACCPNASMPACVFAENTIFTQMYSQLYSMDQSLQNLVGLSWTATIPKAPQAKSPGFTVTYDFVTLHTNLLTLFQQLTTLSTELQSIFSGLGIAGFTSLPFPDNTWLSFSNAWANLQATYAPLLTQLTSIYTNLAPIYTAVGATPSLPVLPPPVANPVSVSQANLQTLVSTWNGLSATYAALWTKFSNIEPLAAGTPMAFALPPSGFSISNLQTLIATWDAIQSNYTQFLSTLPTLITNLGTVCTSIGTSIPNAPAAPKVLFLESDFTALAATWTSLQNTYTVAFAQLVSLRNTLQSIYTVLGKGTIAITMPGPTISEANIALMNTAFANLQTAYTTIWNQLTQLWPPLQQLSTATGYGALPQLPGTALTPANITALITAWKATDRYGTILTLLNSFWIPFQQLSGNTGIGTLPQLPGTALTSANITALYNAWKSATSNYGTIFNLLSPLQIPLQQIYTTMEGGTITIQMPTDGPMPSASNMPADMTKLATAWGSMTTLYGGMINQLNILKGDLQTLYASMGAGTPAITVPTGTSPFATNITALYNAWKSTTSSYGTILNLLSTLQQELQQLSTDMGGGTVTIQMPRDGPTPFASNMAADITMLVKAWGSMATPYGQMINQLNSLIGDLQTLYGTMTTMGLASLPSITPPPAGTSPSLTNITALNTAWKAAQAAYTNSLGLYENVATLIPSGYGPPAPTPPGTFFTPANITALYNAWTIIQTWYKKNVATFRFIQPTGNILTDLGKLKVWIAATSSHAQNAQACFANHGIAAICNPYGGKS